MGRREGRNSGKRGTQACPTISCHQHHTPSFLFLSPFLQVRLLTRCSSLRAMTSLPPTPSPGGRWLMVWGCGGWRKWDVCSHPPVASPALEFLEASAQLLSELRNTEIPSRKHRSLACGALTLCSWNWNSPTRGHSCFCHQK